MAKKDLIIGAFKNYDFNKVKPWVDSINTCGFKGDKVVISINSTVQTNQKLTDSGFGVLSVDSSDSRVQVHMERFVHIYSFLKDRLDDYRYVITTDVRDVIFQRDPIPFIEQVMNENSARINPVSLLAVSEGIKIKDEAWNKDNIFKTFGPHFAVDVEDKEVLNVGTIAGKAEAVKDLCGMIFQLSMNRPDWVADQAAYNILMNWEPYKSCTDIVRLRDAWACNLHVTNKPDQLQEFGPYLLEERPIFEDGLVKDGKNKEPFAIVHQYDRVPEMLAFFNEKYEITNNDDMITIKI
jgi:hypothetical protein